MILILQFLDFFFQIILKKKYDDCRESSGSGSGDPSNKQSGAGGRKGRRYSATNMQALEGLTASSGQVGYFAILYKKSRNSY